MRVAVHGLGYVGAVHAAALASLGHDVVAVDTDLLRVTTLAQGVAPFYEPGLEELLQQGSSAGRLHFTSRVQESIGAQVHFICVGTPQRSDAPGADLTAIRSVVDDLAGLVSGPVLIVGKSTVPVGTATMLRDSLRAKAGSTADLAWNPEFLREGLGVADSLRPDRLVFGVVGREAADLLRQVYRRLIDSGAPVVVTDLPTAELAKESANALLAARLSLANVLSELCESAGADVRDLVEIVGLDHRIGPQYLKPGVGFGGSCLPKDLRALVSRGEELGVGESLRLFLEVDAVNQRQQTRIVDWAFALVGNRGRVGVLGAAFKGGSDDVRESPALAIASALHERGVAVTVYDPLALAAARGARPELTYADSIESGCADADLVLLLTDSPEYAAIDPVALRSIVATPTIIDGRMMLDPEKWSAAGWRLHAPGTATR